MYWDDVSVNMAPETSIRCLELTNISCMMTNETQIEMFQVYYK